MYYKYGLVLRGLPGGHSFLTGLFERVCQGNCYPATREPGPTRARHSSLAHAETLSLPRPRV